MAPFYHTTTLDVFKMRDGWLCAVSRSGEWLARGKTLSQVLKDAKKILEYLR